MATFKKDPDAELDYSIDWAEEWLVEGDSIIGSTWVLPDGITIHPTKGDTFTTTTTTIWLIGGTIGEVYTLTNYIETADGRKVNQRISFKIRDK